MELSGAANLQSNKLLTPAQVYPIAARDNAATEADSATNPDCPGHGISGQSASTSKPDYFPTTLPFQVWCVCGHISGQHGAKYPHRCACDGNVNGSVCKCEAFRESAGTGSAMASPHFPDPVEGGADLASRRSALDFYRPRFLVLPTGRMIFAWGIWDSQKQPGSIPTRIFQMSDFVKRFKAANLGKAYAFARRLNEKHEQKAVA